MSKNHTVHTKSLGENRYRDLNAYYDKGGMNYWDYSTKPKGIYFASQCYSKSEGIRSWSTGQKGDGYLLITPLDRYRPTALRTLQGRIKDNADQIHTLIEAGKITELQALLSGEAQTKQAA